MDPDTAWREFLDACQQRDWSEAQETASALLEWLDRGGFPPESQPDRTLDDALNRAIVAAACRHVLDRPEPS